MSPPAAAERRFRLGLLAAGVVGFVVRLWAVATVGRVDPTGGDGFYYHSQANLLAKGHLFVDPYRLAATGSYVPGNAHPPLYTVWLSISSLLGGTDYRAHKTMSCLAGLLTVVLIGLLARELAGRRAGLVAAGLAAVYPPFWIIGGLLMPEELYAGLIAGLLLVVLRWRRSTSWAAAAGIGAVLALASLTRAEAIGLAPLLVVPVVLLARQLPLRRRLAHLAVAGLACCVVLAPWVVRNAVSFHRFEPFSTNGDELFVYANNPIAYGTNDAPIVCSNRHPVTPDEKAGARIEPQGAKYLGYWYFPWEEYLRCEHGEPPGDPSDKAIYWRKQGLQYMKDHKGRLPVVVAARVGRVWEVYRPFQNAYFGIVEGRTQWVSDLGLWVYWALLATSIPGLVVLRRRRAPIWPLLSMAVLVTVTVVYAYGNERFRLPLDVAVVVGAAVAIDALLGRWWPRVDPGPAESSAASPEDDDREPWRARVAGLARVPWRTVGAVSVVALAVLVPLRGLMLHPGAPMEEGFMLTFPERVLHGQLPNRDFLHLYGPGSLWFLSAFYWLFGTSVATERLVGLVQVLGIAAGVAWLLRPFGRVLATTGAVVVLAVVLPPLGLTALAWNGGVALVVLGLATLLAARARRPAGDPATDGGLRWFGVGGLLVGLALTFRPDLVVAAGLGLVGALWAVDRRVVRRTALGGLAGLSPYLVHLATAGPRRVVVGMVVDPVFRLRGGRTLPIPPPWNEISGFMQRAANLRPLHWPLPHLQLSREISLWFWIVPAAVVVVVVAGLREQRRAPASPAALALLTAGLLSLGMVPQAVQRADATHFAWASCVSLAVLPAAVARLLPGAQRTGERGSPSVAWRPLAGMAVVAVLLAGALPLLTVRTYVDYARQSFGHDTFGWPIRRNGRTFSYGSPEIAAAGNALVADLDTRARPGQRLFVGPLDLRKTPYSQAFWYFLYPDLTPATYFIEMDPWLDNRPGSRLASDVRSADWLILTTVGESWDEPNASRKVGSDAPNQVVRTEFCLVGRYGATPAVPAGVWQLYGRCSLVRDGAAAAGAATPGTPPVP